MNTNNSNRLRLLSVLVPCLAWLGALRAIGGLEPGIFVPHALAGILIIVAAEQDIWSFRLPMWLTLPAAALVIAGEGLFGDGWGEPVAGAVTGFCALMFARLLARLQHKKECIGGGDAVLMLSIGALTGVAGLVWVFAVATCLLFFGAKLFRVERLPFGPFLAGAGLVVAVILQGSAVN